MNSKLEILNNFPRIRSKLPTGSKKIHRKAQSKTKQRVAAIRTPSPSYSSCRTQNHSTSTDQHESVRARSQTTSRVAQNVGWYFFFFSLSSHSRCEVKRAGKKAQFLQRFEVPGSKLAWSPLLVSFSLCFSTSRLFEIIRAGDENSYNKRNRLKLSTYG